MTEHNTTLLKRARQGWEAIQNYFLPGKPAYVSQDTDLNVLLVQGRDRILTIILRLISLLGTLLILSIMGDLLRRERWDLVVSYLAGMITIGLISYLRRVKYTIRALTFLGILYLLGSVDLAFFGIAEDWRLYYSGFTILAALFLGWRAGLAALFLSLSTFVTLAWQISIGRIVITASAMFSPIPDGETIVAFSLVFFIGNGIFIAAITTLLNEFENATRKEREAAINLEQRTAELEKSLAREQQLTHEVAYALQRQEALNKLRSKIITTISHEFRTPLTVINNSTSLLDKYYDRLSPSKRQEQYSRIRQSIAYLTDLLQDVSMVEKTQEEALNSQHEMTQFGVLCEQLAHELRQETADPPNLEINVTGEKQTVIVLDYHLLKQVLYSLLTNALKYSSDQQPVQLNITCEEQLTLSVVDQGMGIPDADKAQIWELFYRGSNVDSRSGLGLGLFIVKQLLETMGGTIIQADNPAGGTIFTVTLPREAPAVESNP